APDAEHLGVRELDVARELALPASVRDLDEPRVELERNGSTGEDRPGRRPRACQRRRVGEVDLDGAQSLSQRTNLSLAGLREGDVCAALVAALAIPCGLAVAHQQDVHDVTVTR